MASLSPKSLTIQSNRASSLLCLPEGTKGVAVKSWQRKNAPGTMDSVQPADPFRRLFHFGLADPLDLGIRAGTRQA